MVPRRSWRVPASLLSMALAIGTLAAPPTSAQDPVMASVLIEPVGTDGIGGLALLSPAANGGTDVQILVAGAPTQTFAVVHAGTCDAVDPTPVALLGDVSTTSQVTVANPFESLADGEHVLAVHRGLDLASAVGCGSIPAMTGSPTPDETDPPEPPEGSYAAPDGSFAIAWPTGWQTYEVLPVEGEARIGLSNGLTSVLIAGRIEPGTDAQACVREARGDLFDRLDSGALRDLEPLTDAQGAAVSGAEAGRAWLAYRYVSVEQAGEFDVADYLECRTAGDVVVFILHRSAPATYGAASGARDALLAGLTLGGGVGPRPTEAPRPTAAAGGGSYTAPTVGFTLTWDGRWTEYAIPGLERYEHVSLSDGPSRVAVSGIIDPAWDALACAQDSDADFQVRAGDGRIRDLEPLVNPDGSRLRGGDTARAWIGYRYTDAESGGAVAEYHECRAANTVVVRIQHRSLPDVYGQEAAARDELLQGLTLPTAPPPAPAPTPNAACDGYPAWHEATLARFDALTKLKSDVDEAAMAYDEPRLVAAYVRASRDLQRMSGEQERDPVPPAARAANALAAEALGSFAAAARIFAEYYQSSTTTPTLQRAARAQHTAERVEADFNVALSDVEAACG